MNLLLVGCSLHVLWFFVDSFTSLEKLGRLRDQQSKFRNKTAERFVHAKNIFLLCVCSRLMATSTQMDDLVNHLVAYTLPATFETLCCHGDVTTKSNLLNLFVKQEKSIENDLQIFLSAKYLYTQINKYYYSSIKYALHIYVQYNT